MKRLYSLCLLAAAVAALPLGASADGFAAVAGIGGNCHFTTESTLGSFTADEAGAVHHGALVPFTSGTSAAIATVDAAGRLSLAYDRASATLRANASTPAAEAAVVALDGRTVLDGTIAEGTLDLSALAHGIYIVRVTDTTASATIKIVR